MASPAAGSIWLQQPRLSTNAQPDAISPHGVTEGSTLSAATGGAPQAELHVFAPFY